MPWRALPGERADPYRVWLSEIMLQQTTVAAVAPYFQRFLASYPTVASLAGAPEADVLRAWAGLGYYARARNLHRCARLVAAAGAFPVDVTALRALPGVGAYTAAAIASIAFDVPAVAIDGNVERIVARLAAIEEPLPASRQQIAACAGRLGQDPAARARPADFTQALFDLGAMVCTPRAPTCALCPWRDDCLGHARGSAASLPRKAPKPPRPRRYGAQFWLQDASGAVLLLRRPDAGLLGGMLALPGTEWRDRLWPQAEALAHAPEPADWQLAGSVRHGFTHFELELDVYYAKVVSIVSPGLRCEPESGALVGLPTVMRRCVEIIQKNAPAFTSR